MSSLRKSLEFLESFSFSEQIMPTLFIGHGSPMNAIEENEISKNWQYIGEKIPTPNAVLCISAHWITPGETKVHISHKPRQIYDFYGFPEYLYDLKYEVDGNPQYARKVTEMVKKYTVGEDVEWGLDHGAWVVLCQMYPDAHIPIFQLSLDYNAPFSYHLALGKEIADLRKKGVLVLASGNIVHNLSMMQFGTGVYDWNIEFDTKISQYVLDKDIGAILQKKGVEHIFSLAHPSHDHFLPLLYFLGTSQREDSLALFNKEYQFGSISMSSFVAYQ